MDSPVGPVVPPKSEQSRTFLVQWTAWAIEIAAPAAEVTFAADGARATDALPSQNDRLAVLSHWLK